MFEEENGNEENMLPQEQTESENLDSETSENESKQSTNGSVNASSFLLSKLTGKQKIILYASLAGIFMFFLIIILFLVMGQGSSITYDLPKSYVRGTMTDQELVNYLVEHGHCVSASSGTTEDDCTLSTGFQFWKKIKKVYEDYQDEKDVALNIDVLIATLSYKLSDDELYKSIDQIEILANAMIEEYEVEVIDPDTNEKTTEIRYRLNMNQYKEYIIGTGIGGEDSGGGSGSGTNTQSKQEFLEWIVPLAKELQKVSGILPSVTIAQKVQESSWKIGNSEIARTCHNYFGMKKGSWEGAYKVFNTWEDDGNGNRIYQTAKFRCYESDVEGFIGRGDFFWSYSRYADFLICNFNSDWECAVKAVKAAGYATDTKYVSALTNIINQNQLYQYDDDPDYQWDGTYPEYADYDPYTKQSIGDNSNGTDTEVYIVGGGYIEKYRPDLLEGYKDSEKLQRKITIYEEILDLSKLSDNGNSSENNDLNFSMYSCSSPPIKIQSGETYKISSPYGLRIKPIADISSSFHNGIDIAGYPIGTEVHAVAQGTVVEISTQLEGGNFVRIGHDLDNDGKYDNYTGYYHLSGFAVSYGEKVTCGQVIGYVGQSGMATGPHLHFGLQDQNQKFIDPTSLLNNLLTKTSIFDSSGSSDGEYYGYYNQGQFGNVPYCSGGKTIQSSGCALASFATAVTNLTNKEVSMSELANFVCTQTNYRTPDSGTSNGFWDDDIIAPRYDVKISRLSRSEMTFENLYAMLQSGKKLIVSVQCCGKFKVKSGSHLIELNSAENDKILVYDVGNRKNVGWYTKSEVDSQIIGKIYSGMWYIEKR